MLRRSFKSAKCKTSLKLAASRIKLLKNKKEAQVKQMKRELAQLLEAGQDQTARIRVEHVVREEKTRAAYDLLEIYCELIAARLQIIESQKNCPIDLKEAIASVIFASPRCADIPELLDVHKHFTTKYGKEFTSAAVELRPDCGVSRMLVEKLSAKAPDGQTKIKILSAIAEEHNVKWDPESFGERELNPPDDLLNGPNTFEKASNIHSGPPVVQTPSSNIQTPPSRDQKHNAPVNFEDSLRSSTSFHNAPANFEHNARSSTTSQNTPVNFEHNLRSSSLNFAYTDIGGGQATIPVTSHHGVRPSGTGSERIEIRHSYSSDGRAFSLGRQNWNMEFKDATAAAQAAAESAEQASMAARAAAELSARENITRQYSTESQKSNIHASRDKEPRKNAASKFPPEQFAKNSGHNFHDRNPQIQMEQMHQNEHDNPDEAAERFYRDDHGSTKRSSWASLISSTASVDDEKLMNDFQKANRYSQKSQFKEEAVKTENSAFFSGMRMKKQFSGSEVGYVSGQQSDNFDYFGGEMIRKQASSVSSHSHPSNHGDDYDVSPCSQRKFGIDPGEDTFVGINQGNDERDTTQTSSYNNAAVGFDESGSDDDDNFRFDIWPKHAGQESKLYSTSPVEEPPTHLSVNTHTWSPRQGISGSLEKSSSASHFSAELHSSPMFDEGLTKSAHPSHSDDFVPVSYDVSEGPSSESEDELDKSRLGGKTNPSILPHKGGIFFKNADDIQSESHGSTGFFLMEKGDSRSNIKKDLQYSSDEKELAEVSIENNQRTEFSAESRRKFGFDEMPTHQSSSRLTKSRMASNYMTSEPFYNPVEERKSRLSPQSSRLSSVNAVKATDKTLTPDSPDTMKDVELFDQSSLDSGKELNFGRLTGGLRHKGYIRPPYTRSPSGDASSSSKKAAEDSVTTTEHSPASPAVKSSLNSGVSTKARNKSSSRTPITDCVSDTDDSEELPRQNSRSKRDPYNLKASKEVNTKIRLRPPVTFFDSDDDSEDLPKQTFTSTGHAGSGFSPRTKATSSSGTSSYSKATVGSVGSVNSDSYSRKIFSRNSYGSETRPQSQSQTSNSGHWGSSPEPTAAKQATSRPIPESNVSMCKENLKSAAMEQPSSPLKTVTSASTESPKASTLSGEAPSRESSLKKASHVHPKLPDYDTIAALFQSLRSNRQ